MIGMILDDKVDFAISTFSLRESRMKVVDYLVVLYYPTRGYIYVQNPQETFDWEVYGQPFWQHTWIFVILFCVLAPILMTVILYQRKLTTFHYEYTFIESQCKCRYGICVIKAIYFFIRK